jgi:hypothetical protein
MRQLGTTVSLSASLWSTRLKRVGIFLGNLRRVIVRKVVYNNQFDSDVALVSDAFQARSQSTARVARRDYNRNQWPGGMLRLRLTRWLSEFDHEANTWASSRSTMRAVVSNEKP